MKRERILYLDFIKAVSVVMVVFCHFIFIPLGSFWGNIGMLLTCAAVPCFFVCSGYVLLFKAESSKDSLKRIIRVYGSMVIWRVLYLFFYSSILDVRVAKSELLHYLFLFGEIENVYVGHLWFIQAYMMCLLILPILTDIFLQKNISKILWLLGLVYFFGQFLFGGQYALDQISKLIVRSRINLDGMASVSPFGRTYTYALFYFFAGGFIRILEEKDCFQNKFIKLFGGVLPSSVWLACCC